VSEYHPYLPIGAFEFRTGDNCPCGQGKRVQDCSCLAPDGTLRPRQARTIPPPPKTTFANPKCYAAALHDCSSEISGEHYLSEGILRLIGPLGMVPVSGLAWMRAGEWKLLPVPTLVGNVLCKRHNEALSPLDAFAERVFRTLSTWDAGFADGSALSGPTHLIANGHDMERWMLKALCGGLASGNLQPHKELELDRGWAPDIAWLQFLFGYRPLPRDWGFYFRRPDRGVPLEGGLWAAVLSNRNGVFGISVSLNGREMHLALADPPAERVGTALENTTHRPEEFLYARPNGWRLLKWYWDDEGEGESIRLEMRADSSGLSDG
jgi:hypothetical protein